MAIFKRMIVAVENAFFPARCPYCDKVIYHEQYACEDCKAKMPELPEQKNLFQLLRIE